MKDKLTAIFFTAVFVNISTCQEAFQSQLNALNRKMDILMRENTRLSMENAVLRDDLTEMKDEIRNLKEDYKSGKTSNDKRLLTGEIQISNVAFSARLHHNANLGLHDTVAYGGVVTNTVNAYNPSNGIFTAPVKGLYIISTSIMTAPAEQVHLEIVQNGTPVAYLYSQDNGWDLGSQTIVLQLENGDRVWVRHNPTYDQNGKTTLSGAYNTFSGILVQQLI